MMRIPLMRVISLCCTLALALALSMAFTAPEAQAAKRFGGGGNFGKFFATPKKAPSAPKQTPGSSPSANKATDNKGAAGTAKPAMGGMLGGLLAGGLLAALFMGGAFEGIQMMDILIIAAIAFAAFYFLKRMTQPQQKPQYAGYQPPRQEEMQEPQQAFTSEAVSMGGDSHLAEAQLELPAWFDKEAFVAGAREHFISLQKAWADNDLEQVRSYCHPGFFQIIQGERAALGSTTLDNEVVSVMAEIIGFNERNGQAELSINFYGWMREEGDQESEFNEVWHLTRDLGEENADWFIVGIEQP